MIIYFIIIFTRFERSTQHWLMIRTRHRTVTVSTVDLRDAADWGNVNKLVDEPLAVHLGEDPPLVVIPQRPAHGLVVHVRLVLVEPPQPGHRLAVHQLEDPLLPVRPLDELRAAVFVLGMGLVRRNYEKIGAYLKQFKQELPEIGGSTLPGLALARNAVRSHLW